MEEGEAVTWGKQVVFLQKKTIKLINRSRQPTRQRLRLCPGIFSASSSKLPDLTRIIKTLVQTLLIILVPFPLKTL